MITIGIGCRKDCPADEIVKLVHKMLKASNLQLSDISVLATGWMKAQDASLIRAAKALGLELVYMPRMQMEFAADHVMTQSEHVMAHHGIPSVAETAALAAAGMNAKLLRPRMISAQAACALAKAEAA